MQIKAFSSAVSALTHNMKAQFICCATKPFRVFYVKPHKKIDIVYTFDFFFLFKPRVLSSIIIIIITINTVMMKFYVCVVNNLIEAIPRC